MPKSRAFERLPQSTADPERYSNLERRRSKVPTCELCDRPGNHPSWPNAGVHPLLPPKRYQLIHLQGKIGAPKVLCWQCAWCWMEDYPNQTITENDRRKIRVLRQYMPIDRAIAICRDEEAYQEVYQQHYVS